MAKDALDPGPDGSYPNWPRLPDGSPDPARMPRGLRWQWSKDRRRWVRIDVTPRDPDGNEIHPPTIPPG